MRLHEVPPELVRRIATEAILAYREQREWYEQTEEAAQIVAVAEVVEACAVDPAALEAERRAEPEPAASQDELPF